MFRSKSIYTILVVACMVGLLATCAVAQKLYTDYGPGNDIYRYNADWTPAGLVAGNPLLADLPTTAVNQPHEMAYNPSDGYLYVTSHYDGEYQNPTNQWGPGANYVTRINASTGARDLTWQVAVGAWQNWNKAASPTFAPDGRLYATDKQVGSVVLIDIATQTSTIVVPGGNSSNYIAFDSFGDAYVSTYSAGVRRYTVSGTGWARDMSYGTGGQANIPTGGAWGLAYNANDGFLYVNDYYGAVYRLNSAGVLDQRSPGVTWTVNTGMLSSTDMDFGPDGRLYVRATQELKSVNVDGTPVWQTVMTGYGWGVAWDPVPVIPASLDPQMYMEDGYANDILRYDADGNPAGIAGGSDVFADLPATSGQPQPHHMAYNPNDGYLYVTSYYDGEYQAPANQWGPGSNYVTRINAGTGLMDQNWKVAVGEWQNWNKAASPTFAPDGRLYVTDKRVGSVVLINIATQTSTLVVPGGNSAYYVTFDDDGNAYVATSSSGVQRYTVSGTNWTRDMSYGTGGVADVPVGYEWGMVVGPDGMLYVNNYYGAVYRFNSAGVRDPIWGINTSTLNSSTMCFGPDDKLYVPCFAYGEGGVKRCKTDWTMLWEPAAPQPFSGFVWWNKDYPINTSPLVEGVAWANCPARIKGNVKLQGLVPGTLPVSVTIKLIQGGVTQRTETVTLDSAGNYQITNVPIGVYDISFTASTWATTVVRNVIVRPVGNHAKICNASLASGDLSGDGVVTGTDAGIVVPNLDQKGN